MEPTKSWEGDAAYAGVARSPRPIGLVVTGLLIALVGFAIPIALASHYGALGIPRSDDWSYSVTLFRLVDDGHLSFNHWVSMSLVGQLALAAPVAALSPRNLDALQITTTVLGVCGLGALAGTTRAMRVGWLGVVLVTGSVAAGPLWGPLAVSFMTDIPTFACSSVALILAVVALRRESRSTGLLVTSLAFGWFAFTIRQYAIVTVIAVLIVIVVDCAARGDQRGLRRWIGAAVLVAGATVVFLVWWNSVPDGRSLGPALPRAGSIRTTVIKSAGFIRLIGLMTLPVLLWARPIVRVRRAWAAAPILAGTVGAVTAVALAGTALRVPGDAFVGNYLMRDGVLSDIVLVGRRPMVVPTSVWRLLIVVGSAAGLVLIVAAVPALVALVRRIQARDLSSIDLIGLLLGVGITGYVLVYAAAMLTGLQVYDRYALPLVALVSLALARSRPATTQARVPTARPTATPSARASTVGAVAALGALAVLGVVYTADSASFDGARWRAAEAAVRAGWPARTVNGGFEWRNFHRRAKLEALDRTRPVTGRELVCVTVHINPGTPPGEVVAIAESAAPTRATARVVAFRTKEPCPGIQRRPRR